MSRWTKVVLVCVLVGLCSAVPRAKHTETKSNHVQDKSARTKAGLKQPVQHDEEQLHAEENLNTDDGNPFSFEDIFNSSLSPRSFSVRWINGEDAYTYRKDGDLLLYDITANRTEVLVPESVFDQVGATEYGVSPDRRYVLLGYDVESLWRHSYLARYKIYDTQAGPNSSLIDYPNDVVLQNARLQLAKWDRTGISTVFVFGNNLYYQADPYSPAVQFTFTGEPQTIFNGHSDWLYEEEILATQDASWFSPDSALLCYAVFDDTDVPIFRFPYYGPKENVYGNTIEIAYPKAGDLTEGTNTRASLFVANMADLGGARLRLNPPASLSNEDHYFTKVEWMDSTTVTIVWANRTQNFTVTSVCDVISETCNENRQYTQVGGWTDPDPFVVPVEGGQAYLSIIPKDVLSSGSWNHLAYITAPAQDVGQVTYLTDGEQDVKDIEGFDPNTNVVYYRTTDGDPRVRQLYKVGTPLADPADQTPVCLTCNLGQGCLYVTASFSTTGRYYVLGCLGPDIPRYTLQNTQTGFVSLLEDNADVSANLEAKDMPTRQFLSIPVGGGFTAYASVLSPPTAGEGDSFPLLVSVYAGPGSQAVDYRFDTGFETFLASSEGVVVASLDGRGTASRGNDFKFLVYRNLGNKEIEDQLIGGSNIANTLSYVDSSKTAIWGWSYGGFAAAHSVANETNFYKCAIIGAALSDRRYYDTAHTERFMGRASPEDNQAGYEDADVMGKTEYFKNKTILIVHGTADDNVHFASSAQLIKTLQDAEIQFRLQIYPDKNHYFSGSSPHLYRLYTDFLLNDCWAVPSQAKQVKILY